MRFNIRFLIRLHVLDVKKKITLFFFVEHDIKENNFDALRKKRRRDIAWVITRRDISISRSYKIGDEMTCVFRSQIRTWHHGARPKNSFADFARTMWGCCSQGKSSRRSIRSGNTLTVAYTYVESLSTVVGKARRYAHER